jgi:hypothetical protein
MRGNSQELESLKTFLNLELGKVPRNSPILGNLGPLTVADGASLEAVEFVKYHNLVGREEMIQVQMDLRSRLSDLVSPESIIPFRAGKEIRERSKREVVDKYLSNPERLVARLINDINRAGLTSRWELYRPTAKKAAGKKLNLHVRGSAWLLERSELLGAKDTIYQWLIRLLERDEISKLGRCRICWQFFVSNRKWKKDCDSKCKKTYDNALSAERKAERKVVVAAEQRRKSARDEKKELSRILESSDFRKRLPGGLASRARMQADLVKRLDVCKTAQEFKQQCEPQYTQIINAML